MNRTELMVSAFQSIPYDEHHDNPFVVLEGVSGIGKSTLAVLLAHRIDGTSLHTLAPPHSGWSDEVHRMGPLANLAFYLSGLLHVSDGVRGALAFGPVIADRYASSVTACQAAIHGVSTADVDRLVAPFLSYLVAPTHTFYLRCSQAALRERLAAKEDTKQDDTDLLGVPGRLEQLMTNFETVAANDPTAIVLNTDGFTPDDLADAITAYLENLRA
ncbi:dTMP kinase [Streptomyces sp. NBC_00096]|uniref:dTMP kinase n=1 Tax=Streptomyces sp. NBC_00096 TaxID=2975650 RepID=UPI00324ED65E